MKLKTLLCLLSLLSAAGLAHSAAAASCCATAAAVPPKQESCCPTLDAEPFSPDSVFLLEGSLMSDQGEAVALSALRGKPVVLAMFFSSCTYACPILVADMTQIRAALPESLKKDVALVLVSFDPLRDTPATLREFRKTRGLDSQWTLLTGTNDTVAELAAVLGVKYTLQSDGQFAHSNLITVLNREGEIVHQRTGLKGGHERVVEALVKQSKR